MRRVSAGTDGIATGDDSVSTIYGTPPRRGIPQAVTFCLAGLWIDAAATTDETIYVLDACQGFLIALDRTLVSGGG